MRYHSLADENQMSFWHKSTVNKPTIPILEDNALPTLSKIQQSFLHNKLITLSKSRFRSSFKLRKNEQAYIKEKGIHTIYKHACNLIAQRLAPQKIANDGRQTPMRGHPVFIAQHATGTCCRKCLNKWHRIQTDKALSIREQHFIVALIMEWIKKQIND